MESTTVVASISQNHWFISGAPKTMDGERDAFLRAKSRRERQCTTVRQYTRGVDITGKTASDPFECDHCDGTIDDGRIPFQEVFKIACDTRHDIVRYEYDGRTITRSAYIAHTEYSVRGRYCSPSCAKQETKNPDLFHTYVMQVFRVRLRDIHDCVIRPNRRYITSDRVTSCESDECLIIDDYEEFMRAYRADDEYTVGIINNRDQKHTVQIPSSSLIWSRNHEASDPPACTITYASQWMRDDGE